jgi:hypothetical protein
VSIPGHLPLRRRLVCQRGQDTVEWAGVLVIVALIIAAIVAFAPRLGTTLGHDMECVIKKIFGGGCTAPAPYVVSVTTKTVGYNGRVGFVNGGHGYTLTLTKYSNGTSAITAVNTGTLGVSAQVGAGVELGPIGGASAQASIGGGGYGDQTTTWTFPSWSAGQSGWGKISGGSSLGLAVHDGASATLGAVPLVGGTLSGVFDSVTGAHGAPGRGSLPGKPSSTAVGGGAQGSAKAGANVSFGGFSAGVNASLAAHAGLEHITSGPQKNDWQLTAGLDGSGDASLLGALFGAQASLAGKVNGAVTVTFSASGAPLTLAVAASGNGVWGIVPPGTTSVRVPVGSPSGSGKGSGNGSSGAPMLSVQSDNAGGSGVGTSFVGTLNLATDPQAQSDLEALLEGNPAKLPALISDMNSNGTETVQTYKLSSSNSTVGASVSVGVGGGANLTDGSSTATYYVPETRQDGGPWQRG